MELLLTPVSIPSINKGFRGLFLFMSYVIHHVATQHWTIEVGHMPKGMRETGGQVHCGTNCDVGQVLCYNSHVNVKSIDGDIPSHSVSNMYKTVVMSVPNDCCIACILQSILKIKGHINWAGMEGG